MLNLFYVHINNIFNEKIYPEAKIVDESSIVSHVCKLPFLMYLIIVDLQGCANFCYRA